MQILVYLRICRRYLSGSIKERGRTLRDCGPAVFSHSGRGSSAAIVFSTLSDCVSSSNIQAAGIS